MQREQASCVARRHSNHQLLPSAQRAAEVPKATKRAEAQRVGVEVGVRIQRDVRAPGSVRMVLRAKRAYGAQSKAGPDAGPSTPRGGKARARRPVQTAAPMADASSRTRTGVDLVPEASMPRGLETKCQTRAHCPPGCRGMSALAAQLRLLSGAAPPQHANRPSLLFDSAQAADTDISAIYQLGVSGAPRRAVPAPPPLQLPSAAADGCTCVTQASPSCAALTRASRRSRSPCSLRPAPSSTGSSRRVQRARRQCGG